MDHNKGTKYSNQIDNPPKPKKRSNCSNTWESYINKPNGYKIKLKKSIVFS